MSTPCNSLNVQLIKVSQLANYTSLKDADILMIVENTSGTKYSRNSSLSSVRSYILDNGLSGFPSTSFLSSTDTNNLNSYTSGGVFSYTHNFSSVPSMFRAVLYCNANDGTYSSSNEIDINSCFNNDSKPFATVSVSTTDIKVSMSSFSSVKVYPKSTPFSEFSLNKLNWQIKIYVWK
jgi:hypothetical protein